MLMFHFILRPIQSKDITGTELLDMITDGKYEYQAICLDNWINLERHVSAGIRN
jgi:hypothetical protein